MRHPLTACAILALMPLASCYYLSQGSVLVSHQMRARDAESVLADPKTGEKVKLFLQRAARIRTFAINELGLKDTPNYTSFLEIKDDHLADIVQAAEQDRLVPYLWDYPFFGKMPYKGFYDREGAERLRSVLDKKGYDTLIREVGAFSTLGFFKDPLMSYMAEYREGGLAELIIHEMTHATVFAADQSNFNEEFASFTGRQGALLWIATRYGTESKEYALEKDLDHDAAEYATLLKDLGRELEPIYSSSRTREEKLALKAAVIAAFKARFAEEYDARFRTPYYETALPRDLNNAWIELYKLYEGESEIYGDFLAAKAGGDLAKCVALVRDEAAKGNKDLKSFVRGR